MVKKFIVHKNICDKKFSNSSKTIRINPLNGHNLRSINNLQYNGYWIENKRHGFGALAKKVSDTETEWSYQGYFKVNLRDGKGIGYCRDGFYIGDWFRGMKHGWGMMWYKDGSWYGGTWECNKRHGEGIQVQPDGNRYEGKWFFGERHGDGIMLFLDTGRAHKGLWWHDTAVSGTIQDIPFRQTAPFPAFLGIPPLELKNHEKILQEVQLRIRQGISDCLDEISVSDESF